MDLDQRLREETLVWYYKVAIRWELAKVLVERSPQNIEEAIQRVEDREQEKVLHETVYEERRRPRGNEEAEQETGNKEIGCDY
jgi:hypothetical protein